MSSFFVKLREVSFNKSILKFYSPNKITDWRIDTFHSKEPETVDWLAKLSSDDVLFDVGANVGMYSIFAAINAKCKVFAFEPESQNYSLLCKNIYVNHLSELISPLCVAITDTYQISTLNLSRFDWDGGGSCHSFGQDVGFDLSPRESPFKQSVVGLSLDELITRHNLPSPTHLKIDVDGFEHNVINGADKLLRSLRLKSICIELNTNLTEHNSVISFLVSRGFFYYSRQVNSSMRKDGPFKGCSEFIFYRSIDYPIRIETQDIQVPTLSEPSSLENEFSSLITSNLNSDLHFDAFKYAVQRIWEEDPVMDPFPFVYINNLFPPAYYEIMSSHFPSIEEMGSLSSTGRVSYDQQRYVSLFSEKGLSSLSEQKKEFWCRFNNLLSSVFFTSAVLSKFNTYIQSAFYLKDDSSFQLYSDSLLVRDLTNYSIGPHTDLPARLVSMLFYMPDTDQYKQYGTSIYKSKDPSFLCPGGPHYKFDDFERIGTAPFLPNSLFMFVRTPKSFHGVEKILHQDIQRKLLISNLRRI